MSEYYRSHAACTTAAFAPAHGDWVQSGIGARSERSNRGGSMPSASCRSFRSPSTRMKLKSVPTIAGSPSCETGRIVSSSIKTWRAFELRKTAVVRSGGFMTAPEAVGLGIELVGNARDYKVGTQKPISSEGHLRADGSIARSV